MNEGWSSAAVLGTLAAAGFFFLLELLYSIVLMSVATLSRVALHRMSGESDGKLAFLAAMRSPPSPHRTAASLARQLCWMAATLLLVIAAHGAGWRFSRAAVGIVIVVMGMLLLEVVSARLFALWDPRAALRRTAFLVPLAHALLFPLVQPLHLLLTRLSRFQSQSEEERDEEQEEEVEAYIEVGERDGILEASEGKMMRSIVDLDETHVREIMTPRTDIVALGADTLVDDARKKILEAGHSRIPVYRDTIDDVIGVLHVRDLLRAWEEGGNAQPISRYLREAMFVPELLSVAELLAEMRVKTHIAVVVDEYGGVAGLVTLDDLLEEIVGEIRDEHELAESSMLEEPDGSWVIDASAHVEELEGLFGIAFNERDFDTVGGFVVAALGRVPREGEKLEIRNLTVEVLKADRRRLRQVRIRAHEEPGSTRAEA